MAELSKGEVGTNTPGVCPSPKNIWSVACPMFSRPVNALRLLIYMNRYSVIYRYT